MEGDFIGVKFHIIFSTDIKENLHHTKTSAIWYVCAIVHSVQCMHVCRIAGFPFAAN